MNANFQFELLVKSQGSYKEQIQWLAINYPRKITIILQCKKYNFKYLLDWINDQTPLLQDSFFTLKTKIYWVLNDIKKFPVCQNECCHKQIKRNVLNISLASYQYCSSTCQLKSQCFKQLTETVKEARYGDKNFRNREKCKCTVEKHKREDPDYYKKINEKIIATSQKNYGVNWPTKAEISLNKIKVAAQCRSSAVISKIQNSKAITFYNKCLLSNFYVTPLFDVFEYMPQQYNKEYTWKCNFCQNVFNDKIETHRYNRKVSDDCQYAKCPICFAINGRSTEEIAMQVQLESYIPDVKFQSSKFILKESDITQRNKQIDIFDPISKTGIEYNGLYYHKCGKKNLMYHLHKTELAEQQGIKLIHIRSDQWLNNKEYWLKLVSDIIYNKLNIFEYLDKNADTLYVDRSIFNLCFKIPGYSLVQCIQPNIQHIKFDSKIYDISDCGYLIYKKNLE